MTAITVRRRRGMTLVELIATIPILAVLTVLAMPLLRASVRSMTDANGKLAADGQADAAVAQLRRDVWGATAVTATAGELTATIADQPVVWRFGADGVHRQAGPDERRWDRALAGATAAVTPSAVRLTVPGAAGRGDRTVVLQRAMVDLRGGR